MNKNKNNVRGKNYKGKRNYKERERRGKDFDEVKEDDSRQDAPLRNKPSYYYSDPVVASQISQFSFNQFLGATDLFSQSSNLSKLKIGTVCRIFMNPSIAVQSADPTSGVNMIAKKWYTMLSAGNAKVTNYSPQDVITLFLQLGELLSLIGAARRAFGAAWLYNQRNRTYPSGIINAVGFEQEDFLNRLAQYRLMFNTRINRINNIPIIDEIDYFEKCENLYSKIYSDSVSPMSQLYVLLPESTWIMDEEIYDQGTALITTQVFDKENPITFENFLRNILDPMIEALLSSSTFTLIYADILRIIQGGSAGMKLSIHTLEMEPEISASAFPEFNPMMLLQIHNAVSIGAPSAERTIVEGKVVWDTYTPENDVYPDMDKLGLVYQPKFITNIPRTGRQEVILDFPNSEGNPDVDQRIEASRMVSIINGTVPEDDHYVISSLIVPDHYVTRITYSFVADVLSEYNTIDTYYKLATTVAKLESQMVAMSRLEAFDYSPRAYLLDSNNDIVGMLSDTDFFTTIDANYLRPVFDLGFMALYEYRPNKRGK